VDRADTAAQAGVSALCHLGEAGTNNRRSAESFAV
jgi:hypothetical protein